MQLLGDKYGTNGLRDAFDSSLGSDLTNFYDFCRTPRYDADSGYRVYRLRGLDPFAFAFCEKNIWMRTEYTLVYLAEDISELYRFMSPASTCFCDTAGNIIHELLYMCGKRRFEPLHLTPEAFLTLSRVPYLTEAVFAGTKPTLNCDITVATEHTLRSLRDGPLLHGTHIILSVNESVSEVRTDTALLTLPLEAYIVLLVLSLSICSAMSCSRSIRVTLTRFHGAAELLISTRTKRLSRDAVWHSTDELSCFPHPVDSFSQIASTVAVTSGLDISYSYSSESGEMHIRILIGGDIPPAADFKYSDPTETVSHLIDDIYTLYKAKD